MPPKRVSWPNIDHEDAIVEEDEEDEAAGVEESLVRQRISTHENLLHELESFSSRRSRVINMSSRSSAGLVGGASLSGRGSSASLFDSGSSGGRRSSEVGAQNHAFTSAALHASADLAHGVGGVVGKVAMRTASALHLPGSHHHGGRSRKTQAEESQQEGAAAASSTTPVRPRKPALSPGGHARVTPD